MVLFIFGRYDFKQVVKLVSKEMEKVNVQHHFPNSTNFVRPITPIQSIQHTTKTLTKNTHQAHVMMGCRGYASDDKRRIALYFLNNLIGGPGMNSLLNVSLREHKGLVYTVESTLTNYTDTATFSIYFGCDNDDTERCIQLVQKELNRLIETPLT